MKARETVSINDSFFSSQEVILQKIVQLKHSPMPQSNQAVKTVLLGITVFQKMWLQVIQNQGTMPVQGDTIALQELGWIGSHALEGLSAMRATSVQWHSARIVQVDSIVVSFMHSNQLVTALVVFTVNQG